MKICENCGEEHSGDFATGRFCSISCSCSFGTKQNRTDINNKVSETLKNRDLGHPKELVKTCPNCKKQFNVKWNKRNQIFCSKQCSMLQRTRTTDISRQAGLKSAVSQNKRSKNEIYFYELCNNYFCGVKCNEPIFNGWDADIIIPSIKIAVLWNGNWHYKKITQKHSLSQVQTRDKIKIDEIIKYGYKPYIIKDNGKYNKEFVEEQFNIFINDICGMV